MPAITTTRKRSSAVLLRSGRIALFAYCGHLVGQRGRDMHPERATQRHKAACCTALLLQRCGAVRSGREMRLCCCCESELGVVCPCSPAERSWRRVQQPGRRGIGSRSRDVRATCDRLRRARAQTHAPSLRARKPGRRAWAFRTRRLSSCAPRHSGVQVQ